MGLTDTVFGTPGQTQINQGKGGAADPGYQFAKWLFNQLPGIANSPYPTYGGQLDPGMSPTLQDAIRRAQGYAQSGPPEIMQGVQGLLGQFMSPNFYNPFNSMFGGAPNYGGVDPNARTFGGTPAGAQTFQAGVGGGGQMPPFNPAAFNPGAPPPGGSRTPPGWGSGQSGVNPPQIPGVPMSDQQRQQIQQNPMIFNASGVNSSPMTGPPSTTPPGWPGGGTSGYTPPGGAPPAGSPFNLPFEQAQGALAQQTGGGQNLLAALKAQYGGGGNFDTGFMHTTDHQAALRQLLGREPTFDEVQKSWRSGPANIEAARKSYQAQAPGVGQENWTPAQKRMNDLISQYGIVQGSKMFDQEVKSGQVSMPGGTGATPPPAGSAPPMPGSEGPGQKETAIVGGSPGGPSTGAGGGAPTPGIKPGETPVTRTAPPLGGSDMDRVTGPPTTSTPTTPLRRGDQARANFLKYMEGIPKEFRQGSPLDYLKKQGKEVPAGAPTNWKDTWRQSQGRPVRTAPPPKGPTDVPVTKPIPPGQRRRRNPPPTGNG